MKPKKQKKTHDADTNQENYIDQMPQEVILQILNELTTKDLINVGRTNQFFREFIRDTQFSDEFNKALGNWFQNMFSPSNSIKRIDKNEENANEVSENEDEEDRVATHNLSQFSKTEIADDLLKKFFGDSGLADNQIFHRYLLNDLKVMAEIKTMLKRMLADTTASLNKTNIIPLSMDEKHDLHKAIRLGKDNVAKYLIYLQLANSNELDNVGLSPIFYAIATRNNAIAKLLLQQTNLKINQTVQMDENIMKLLLQRDPTFDEKNILAKLSLTPLLYAIISSEGDRTILDRMLERADLSYDNPNVNNAWDHAWIKKNFNQDFATVVGKLTKPLSGINASNTNWNSKSTQKEVIAESINKFKQNRKHLMQINVKKHEQEVNKVLDDFVSYAETHSKKNNYKIIQSWVLHYLENHPNEANPLIYLANFQDPKSHKSLTPLQLFESFLGNKNPAKIISLQDLSRDDLENKKEKSNTNAKR